MILLGLLFRPERSAMSEASKRGVNLVSSRCTGPVKGRPKAPLGLPQSVIYCSSVSSAVIYSILPWWTKRTPQHRRAADSDTRQLDLQVSRFFVFCWPLFLLPPLWTLHLHPPLSSLSLCLPFFSHTLFTLIQIKNWGPFQFILLAVWRPDSLQMRGGKNNRKEL